MIFDVDANNQEKEKEIVQMKRGRDDVYDGDAKQRADKTKDFIKSLKFSVPLSSVREVKDRKPCPKCGKNRMFYCYDCLVPTHMDTHPKPLALPIQVNVIYHPGEHRSKSTSLAAATISPDIKVFMYPEIPDVDPEKTLLLYPSPQSSSLSEMDDLHKFEHIVFVDSTWQQSKGISKDERVLKYRHVRIPEQVSLFWRFQNKDPSYLATVEAIYFFLREFIIQLNKSKQQKQHDATSLSSASAFYNGEVDDLLLYYINQYIRIQESYKDDDKSFTTRHFGGYILDGATWEEVLKAPAQNTP